jgi:hypothetical protein
MLSGPANKAPTRCWTARRFAYVVERRLEPVRQGREAEVLLHLTLADQASHQPANVHGNGPPIERRRLAIELLAKFFQPGCLP